MPSWRTRLSTTVRFSKKGARCAAALNAALDDERTAIGESVIGSLLFPAATNKSAPNEVLTRQNERGAPDHAEPLKRPVRSIRPEIP